jgi:hypothetical protein
MLFHVCTYLCTVSVKLFQLTPWKHMKREGMEVLSSLILNLTTKLKLVASLMSWLLYSQEKGPITHWVVAEVAPETVLIFWLFLPPGFEPCIVQSIHNPVTTVQKENTYYLQAVILTQSIQTTDKALLRPIIIKKIKDIWHLIFRLVTWVT